MAEPARPGLLRRIADRINRMFPDNAGLRAFESVEALPASRGKGRTCLVYGKNTRSGLYTDTPRGWVCVDDWGGAVFQRLAETQRHVERALLRVSLPPYAEPQAFEGARYGRVGGETFGADQPAGKRTRSLVFPEGRTGFRSGWLLEWQIGELERQRFAGETVTLAAEFETTPDFLHRLSGESELGVMTTFGRVEHLDGRETRIPRGARGMPGETLEQVSPTLMRLTLDVALGGTEDRVRIDLRKMSKLPVSADMGARLDTQYIVTDDVQPVSRIAHSISRPGRIVLRDLRRSAGFRMISRAGARDFRNGRGMILPAGESSAGAFQATLVPNYSIPPGTRLRATVVYSTTPDIREESLLGARIYIRRRTRAEPGTDGDLRLILDDPQTLRAEIDYTVRRGDSGMEVSLLVNGESGARTTEGRFEVTGVGLEVLSAPGGHTADGILNDYRHAAEADSANRRHFAERVEVAPRSGADESAALAAALARHGGGASVVDPVGYRLHPGEYARETAVGVELKPTDWTTLYSDRPAREVQFDFTFPDGTPRQEDLHGFFIVDSVELRDLSITARNSRYGIHWEAGGLSVGKVQTLSNLRVRHLGADGWGSPAAVGAGLHSDQRAVVENLDLQSTTQAIGLHDNRGFDAPAQVHVRGGYFVAEDKDATSIGLVSQGSGVISRVRLDHCALGSLLRLKQAINLSSDLGNYLGDPCGYHVERAGPPVAWRSEALYDVLALRSRDVEGSSVRVGGSAAPVLFGPAVPIAGGLGYPGRIHSHYAVALSVKDIGDYHPDPTLAARLGDCREEPLELLVEFEDGVHALLDLTEDYRGRSNAEIVDGLNRALGRTLERSGGRAERRFSIERPWTDRARVDQPDGERVSINRAGRVLLHGQALVYVNGGVDLAQAESEPRHFAGIAMRTSVPRERMVAQVGGEIAQAHLHLTFSNPHARLAFGDRLGFGPDGTLVPVSDPDRALLSVARQVEGLPGDNILRFLR